MQKFIITLACFILANTSVYAFGKAEPVPPTVQLPSKYTPEYIQYISEEYKCTSKYELIYVAIDMLKGTEGDFSRKALLGNNLSGYPVKI